MLVEIHIVMWTIYNIDNINSTSGIEDKNAGDNGDYKGGNK
jgi:hypothetical protein